ncbi:damage-inducible protein DinB [Flavobacteriaceae bacterium R38]|nr:damage-inducible protein DinB [Flavobacteriaceae bacterium R38]
MELNKIIAADFENEMTTTRRFFEAISEDVFDFQPHEKSMSFKTLVNHILPIASWVPGITGASEFDWSTYEWPEALTNKESIVNTFDEYVTAAKAALSAITDEELEEPWTMRNGEKVFFTIPKHAALRNLIISHVIHHRAQLGVYLRLNNLKVPASYVSSADENLI